jgi:hypothetical protein
MANVRDHKNRATLFRGVADGRTDWMLPYGPDPRLAVRSIGAATCSIDLESTTLSTCLVRDAMRCHTAEPADPRDGIKVTGPELTTEKHSGDLLTLGAT